MPEAVIVDDVEPQSHVDTDAPPSFDDFVAARSRALWRSAWLLTGDEHKAEDLLQTALVKVWRRWSKIARDGSVEAYARRVLVTTYTDWWRRKWLGEVPTDAVPEEAEEAPQTDVANDRSDLLRALATLSRGQRAVIVLRYFEDLSEAETAAGHVHGPPGPVPERRRETLLRRAAADRHHPAGSRARADLPGRRRELGATQ